MTVPDLIADALIDAGRRMDARGWVPATSGNLSARLDGGTIAITRSGVHKGRLTRADLLVVDAAGAPLGTVLRPSAETLLHCQIYALVPAAQAVLHGHSVAATILSLAAGDRIAFAGYELLKAFEGQTTHAAQLDLPVLDNDQDMTRLAATLAPHVPSTRLGYLIRGHGATMWGGSVAGAYDRYEALEFLLSCELSRKSLS